MNCTRTQDPIGWIKLNRNPSAGIVWSTRDQRPSSTVTAAALPALLRRGEKDLARRLTRWLLTTQRPDGWFVDPCSPYGRVIDSGRVIAGLAGMASEMPEIDMALHRVCGPLIAGATRDGAFHTSSPRPLSSRDGLESLDSMGVTVLHALRDAARVLDDPEIGAFVAKSREWHVRHFGSIRFSAARCLSHDFVAVMEAFHALDAHDVARRGMDELAEFQQSGGGVPAFHDVRWIATPGLFRAALMWRRLGDEERHAAAMALGSGLANGSGGHFGSHGPWAEWFPVEEIALAAVCHADAIDEPAAPRRVAPIESSPSRRVNPCVDLELFRRRDDALFQAEFDRRFPGKWRVLHVGREQRRRNAETVIRALASLGRDYVGIFIGEGDAMPFRLLAKAHGVEARCHFVDAVPRSEMPLWLSHASCIAVPSRQESSGTDLLEALACDAVVVTADKAPMNDMIHDGLTGVLVRESERPEAVADAVERACTDLHLRSVIRSRARHAAERFLNGGGDPAGDPVVVVRSAAPEAAPTVGEFSVAPLTMDRRHDWQQVVAESEDAWFFHLYEHQMLLERAWSAQTLSFLVELDGRVVAAVPIQRWRHAPDAVHSTLMGPGGPAVIAGLADTERRSTLAFCHGVLQEMVRSGGVRQIDVALPALSPRNRLLGRSAGNPLAEWGYRDTSTSTRVVDLESPFGDARDRMTHAARLALTAAERADLEIRPVSSAADIDEAHALHVDACRRASERPWPRSHVHALVQHFVASGRMYFGMARKDGRAVACSIVTALGPTSCHLGSFASIEGEALDADRLVHARGVEWAKSRGSRLHDLGEAVIPAEGNGGAVGCDRVAAGYVIEHRPFHRGRFTAPDLTHGESA